MNLEGNLVRLTRAASFRGAEKRLLALLKQADGSGRTLLISHCGCPDRARNLARAVQQEKRFSSILLTECGVPLALLLGAGGLAVAY